MTDKREKCMAESRWWLALCGTPLHIFSRVCRALPYSYMEASYTDARAYEATTLSVDVVEIVLV